MYDINKIKLIGKAYFDDSETEVYQDFEYLGEESCAFLGADREFSNSIASRKQKCIEELHMQEDTA